MRDKRLFDGYFIQSKIRHFCVGYVNHVKQKKVRSRVDECSQLPEPNRACLVGVW